MALFSFLLFAMFTSERNVHHGVHRVETQKNDCDFSVYTRDFVVEFVVQPCYALGNMPKDGWPRLVNLSIRFHWQEGENPGPDLLNRRYVHSIESNRQAAGKNVASARSDAASVAIFYHVTPSRAGVLDRGAHVEENEAGEFPPHACPLVVEPTCGLV